MYKDALEPVITFFTSEAFSLEFAAAREEYFKKIGKVFEDEPIYESMITAFLEWYLFDRPIQRMGVPPIRLYWLRERNNLKDPNRSILEKLQWTRHSLFEYQGHQKETLKVKDLYDYKTFEVYERRRYAGLEKGDILDVRLLEFDGRTLFSDAMWLHPLEARKFILAEIERLSKETRGPFQKLMFDLAQMKVNRDRYRHLSTEEVYSWTAFRQKTGSV